MFFLYYPYRDMNILKTTKPTERCLPMNPSKTKVFLRSLFVSYLLSALLLTAIAFALYKFRLKESQIRLAVDLVYVLSCALAGFLAGRGLRKNRFFCGVAARAWPPSRKNWPSRWASASEAA